MPTLYIVPTPIGNLEDVTLRSLRILKEVSLILAEDTRRTRKLLSHYQISTPLRSYHQHNKVARLDSVISLLQEKDIALVSSAGMPSISDPGFELIVAAKQAGIEIDVLPGPSAAITAVVAAAIPAPGFLFAGFLPRRAREREKRLTELAQMPYALVFYEAPHRLVELLESLRLILGDRAAAIGRELTKLHQELLGGTLSELIARYEHEEPRGEFTLVVAPAPARVEDRSAEALQDLRSSRERGLEARSAVADKRRTRARFSPPRTRTAGSEPAGAAGCCKPRKLAHD